MEVFEVSNIDFDQYSNRQLAGIPLFALGIALAIILTWVFLYGTPVFLGIEFTGGTELTLRTQDSPSAIQRTFDAEITSIRQIRTQENVYLVTFQSANSDVLASQARSAGYEIEAIETTSPIFGESAQQQALFGLVAAFIGMSIIVFLLFRTFVPSIAVVLSAFSDIVIPIAVMDLLGIELSIGT
ncbi:MAG: protein translocase subunit SecF, partial [Halobacteriaceae archaeon]